MLPAGTQASAASRLEGSVWRHRPCRLASCAPSSAGSMTQRGGTALPPSSSSPLGKWRLRIWRVTKKSSPCKLAEYTFSLLVTPLPLRLVSVGRTCSMCRRALVITSRRLPRMCSSFSILRCSSTLSSSMESMRFSDTSSVLSMNWNSRPLRWGSWLRLALRTRKPHTLSSGSSVRTQLSEMSSSCRCSSSRPVTASSWLWVKVSTRSARRETIPVMWVSLLWSRWRKVRHWNAPMSRMLEMLLCFKSANRSSGVAG
mmetsp:Transcript_151/g.285  ORF Transcript_151/g.285 Transcript_151/m.285 type:complete len:257 (-) Transcript_151:618-1388(-)